MTSVEKILRIHILKKKKKKKTFASTLTIHVFLILISNMILSKFLKVITLWDSRGHCQSKLVLFIALYFNNPVNQRG